MSLQECIARDVLPLLEELFLAAVDDQTKDRYATSCENEKRIIMKDFVREQAVRSKHWATIAQNLLSAELDN